EGERADLDVVTAAARFLLGKADASDLRCAICAVRHVIVVEGSYFSLGNPLGGQNAFGRRQVGELGVPGGLAERDHVADRRDTRHARSIGGIDLDIPTLQLNAEPLEIETGGHGTSARGNE